MKDNNRETIAVTLLAKAETDLFDKALASASFADEVIVVLDVPHEEKTRQIAEKHTKKVFENSLKDFASQKNLLIEKAKSDWIFILDSDEEISEEMQAEIMEILSSKTDYSAYQCKTRNIIFGKWIRHTGWYPDRHTRFFRREKAKYTGLVHEQLEVDGKIGQLRSDLIHHNYQSVNQFIRKQNLYSDLEAERVFKDGRRFSLPYLLGKPLKEFYYRYIQCRGFRDGLHGFLLSLLMAFFRVMVALKVWELEHKERWQREEWS